MEYYQKHIFFCVNQRQSGKQCCAAKNSAALRLHAKSRLKKLDLSGKGKFRVNSAGCLGRCAEGPSVVIYPEGVWYRVQSIEDVDALIDQYILNGKVVKHLLMDS